ncbi:type IVB secretion system protein DotG/IcmE [Legionella dresdenensis]|uniref:Type IVB secretion system protein DotG/IcmE n=1 Tax=Legionella dresdenensis TaxID=450200 RepID=A0ABV8CE78_9GAMM
MAGRKENLKALFTNTRSRVIIIFTGILLVIAIVVGFSRFFSSVNGGKELSSGVSNAPSIQSIPGALDPTAEYAKLQETQNVDEAKAALKTGHSAIPTIIRSQKLGAGVGIVGVPQGGQGGLGFQALGNQANGKPKELWLDEVKNADCSAASVQKAVGLGAELAELKQACTCVELKANGYKIKDLQKICSCTELKSAGYNATDLKQVGFTTGQLNICGFSACELRGAGFSAQEMKDGGFNDDELKGAGYGERDIAQASGLPAGITADDIRKAGCQVEALERLHKAGVTASAIRRINGCSATQLKAAGYNALDLKNAGFTAADLKNAGFTPEQLRQAGYTAKELLDAGFTPDDLLKAGYSPAEVAAAEASLPAGMTPEDVKAAGCSADSLRNERIAGVSAKLIAQYAGCNPADIAASRLVSCDVNTLTAARLKGVSAATIRKTVGCSADALKAAGFTAAELKAAGFTAAELKAAGFTGAELKAAGFTARQLKDAGFTAKELKDLGFGAADLKAAGFTAAELRAAGFTAKELADAGFPVDDLQKAGYTADDLNAAGLTSTQVAGLTLPPAQQPDQVSTMPALINETAAPAATPESRNAQQLQAILKRQNQQYADQRYQQKIQQRASEMQSLANHSIQRWESVSTQTYVAAHKTEVTATEATMTSGGQAANQSQPNAAANVSQPGQQALIKTGDVLFAVIDTSVNSDEPGPILATIVSGKLKGAKLIGSFNLPNNGEKMVINFNTLSVPGAAGSTSISAYAIDPNTARTALSSKTDHHYLLRYGSLFASSFLEGFGNAFQSADTTVSIGGPGGGDYVSVQNGINRSILQNAVIGLSNLGQAWGQAAQQQFNRPITVEVYSGTGIGVLFTQDLTSL